MELYNHNPVVKTRVSYTSNSRIKATLTTAEFRAVAVWDTSGVLVPRECRFEYLPHQDSGKSPKGKRPRRLGAAGVAKGALGLAKAEMGLDKADAQTVAQRQATCERCEQYDFGRCKHCGCYLHAKIRLSREKCPLNKW